MASKKVTPAEVLEYVKTAYNKLDEALAELKDAKRSLENAEEMVGDAFSNLENIPDELSELEIEKDEEEEG